MGSLFRFHQEPMASSSVTTLELPGAYLTVSQLTHGLKTFLGKFHSHNYFDDASVDNNSGNHLVVCEGSRRTCALLYEQRGPLGSRFYMSTGTRASIQTRWPGSSAPGLGLTFYNAMLTQFCLCVHHDIV